MNSFSVVSIEVMNKTQYIELWSFDEKDNSPIFMDKVVASSFQMD